MAKRTITLTDRPPIRIDDAEWPVIACGRWYEGQHEAQAFRSGWLRVRQHADGRAIVYGAFTTAYLHESSRSGGEVVHAHDTCPAIRRVGEDLGIPDAAIRECVEALPVEDL